MDVEISGEIPGEDWDRFYPDGAREYQPAPHIEPDFRVGFDADGNWHTNPNGAHMDTPHSPNFPYRKAVDMQDMILGRIATEEFYVGTAERRDMAGEIADDWFRREILEPPDLAYEALKMWMRIYG